jgi:hypothetical protein
MKGMTRRELLTVPLALAAACGVPTRYAPGGGSGEQKRVAAIVTEYCRNSHAEMIVGRMLERYEYEGERIETPHLKVAYRAPGKSMFSRGPVPKAE